MGYLPIMRILLDGETIYSGVKKFGALAGGGCRIGANAVLDPGSVLEPGTIIGRLEHYST